MQSREECKIHKATIGPLDRHEGPRLDDGGFMVIETNNEACAQLQLALHTRWSLAPTLELQLPAPIG